ALGPTYALFTLNSPVCQEFFVPDLRLRRSIGGAGGPRPRATPWVGGTYAYASTPRDRTGSGARASRSRPVRCAWPRRAAARGSRLGLRAFSAARAGRSDGVAARRSAWAPARGRSIRPAGSPTVRRERRVAAPAGTYGGRGRAGTAGRAGSPGRCAAG